MRRGEFLSLLTSGLGGLLVVLLIGLSASSVQAGVPGNVCPKDLRELEPKPGQILQCEAPTSLASHGWKFSISAYGVPHPFQGHVAIRIKDPSPMALDGAEDVTYMLRTPEGRLHSRKTLLDWLNESKKGVGDKKAAAVAVTAWLFANYDQVYGPVPTGCSHAGSLVLQVSHLPPPSAKQLARGGFEVVAYGGATRRGYWADGTAIQRVRIVFPPGAVRSPEPTAKDRIFESTTWHRTGKKEGGWLSGFEPAQGARGRMLESEAYAIALQPDGKAVAAGSASDGGGYRIAIARYDARGGLDEAFGKGGKATFRERIGAASLVGVDASGKIAVVEASSGGGSFFIGRFKPDGTPDKSFSGGGQVALDVREIPFAPHALAVLNDGRSFLAGLYLGPDKKGIVLGRYKADGSPDSAFGGGGRVVADFQFDTPGFLSGETVGMVRSVAIQPDGKMVVVGGSGADFALARYNPDGSLDKAFGKGGKVTTDFQGGPDAAHVVRILPDGKVLAGGSSQGRDQKIDLAMARYNPDGSLDSSFGRGGKLVAAFDGDPFAVRAMAVQADGKILTAGKACNGYFHVFSLARYNPDGTPDKTFGRRGKVTTDFSSGRVPALDR